MFSTSHDILLLTIAACVAAFTIFLCWGMFYLIAGVRNIYNITKEFKNIFRKIEETIDLFKNKIHESSTYLVLLGELLKKGMEVAHHFSEKREEKREAREAEAEDCAEDDCADESVSDIKKSRPQKVKAK